MADNEVSMMLSVLPGAMTGFAALNSGLVSINNIFMQTMARIDDNFGVIDASIIAAGALVAQFAKDSMDAFGEFEQGMKIVQMVSGQTAQDIQYLGQKANEFSVSYRTDIDQITEGLQTLGRAGLNSASEQSEVLQNGLNTAKLEGRDLNGVLEELIQNTALLGGNLKSSNFGEDSQYINDLLVGTSMTAPITTHDISETLKYSGGIAAAAGAKIRDESGNENEAGKAILEDYMGTVAAFAQKGVTGSIAGTALRAFLNKPATQDSSVTEALSSIHLKPEYLWEDDEETMKPISQQIEIITKQMDKLDISTMDRLQIWSKIVGGKMGQQMIKLDSDDIKELTKDIQSADDATSLAQRSMQTYQANLKEIGESGAALQRNIGGNLVAIANPYLEIITRIIELGNTDVMSLPITGGIIAFIGLVATKIKGVISTLRTELGTIFSAIKVGADMITARQLKGDRGKRQLLPGERYTQTDLDKEVTPGQLLKGFRQQFQDEAAKSLVGLTKENAAIVEASKGWSAKSELLNPEGTNVKYVSDDGKSFMQARDNQIIAQLARHNMLTPEIQKAFFMGTKKEEIMSTMLSNGATVREEIESLFLQLQSELQKTATVLEEASIAAEEVSGAEQKKATTEKKTSQETSSAAERAAQQAKSGYESAKADFDAMWKGVNAAASEMKADTGTTAQTIVMNTKAVADSIMLEFEKLAMGVSAFNKIPTNIPSRIMPPYINPSIIPNIYPGPHPLISGESVLHQTPTPDNGKTPPHVVVPNELLNTRPVSQKAADDYRRAQNAKILEEKDTAMRAAQAEHAYNNPYIPEKTGRTKTDARIEGALRGKRLENDFKEYDNAMAENIKRKTQAHLENAGKSYSGAVGVGSLPSLQTSFQNQYEGMLKSNMALLPGVGFHMESLKEQEEIEKRQNLSRVQYGEEMLRIDQERLATEEKILLQQRDKAARGRTKDELVAQARQEYADKENAALQNVQNIKKQNDMNALLRPKNEAEMVHGKSDSTFYSSTTPPMSSNPYDRETINQRYEQERAIAQQEMEERDAAAKEQRIRAERLKIRKERQEEAQKSRTIGERIKSPFSKKQTPYDPYNYNATMFPTLFGGKPLPVEDKTPSKGPGMWASFKGTLGDRWNQDRSGRFLNFGQGRIGGRVNGALNMLDAVGGPFMVAMMAIPAIMNYVQGIYENYTQELKDIKETISSAYSDRRQAEDSLEQIYREQNPDAEKEAASDYVLKQYGKMYDSLRANNNDFSKWIEKTSQSTGLAKKYEMDEEKDDGSMKEVEEEEKSSEEQLTEAINQNNSALYEATAQLQLATNKLVGKIQDGMWGSDGFSSVMSDTLGSIQDTWFGFTEGSGSVENGFLKTASQKDENYAGDTELTGLMLEDFKDSRGYWANGMRKILGSDFDDFASTLDPKTKKVMQSAAKFSNSLGAGTNARLQSSMMNDRKSWQKLAKEMAKYQKKTGKHAMTQETKNKRMENLIKKLQIDTHLNRAQVIAAAQLQQLQDMYSVAEQAFIPLMSEQAAKAAQLYNTTANEVLPQTGNAAGGAVGTEGYASAIASYLSVMAQNAAVDAAYQQDLLEGKTTATSKEQYLQEAAGQHIKFGFNVQDEKGLKEGTGPRFIGIDTTIGGDKEKQKRIAHALEYQGDRIRNPEWTDKQVSDYSKRIDRLIDQGMSFTDAMELARKNYAGAVAPQVDAAYHASSVGEEEGGSGGSGGGGSGSGNKDNTGTRKERVDLVLCSKKEIPKLNVNLFKKPPTFTVLNKNFKVRDVKINTEDTPKAIMSAIKNSFIDVQKRSDPKIIQDEEGVYNPEEATEGNPLPSGTAKTRTD